MRTHRIMWFVPVTHGVAIIMHFQASFMLLLMQSCRWLLSVDQCQTKTLPCASLVPSLPTFFTRVAYLWHSSACLHSAKSARRSCDSSHSSRSCLPGFYGKHYARLSSCALRVQPVCQQRVCCRGRRSSCLSFCFLLLLFHPLACIPVERHT